LILKWKNTTFDLNNQYNIRYFFDNEKFFVRNLELKYRINDKLESLPYREYVVAVDSLPELLEIPQATFQQYLNAKVDDELSVSVEELILLAEFFNCRVEELLNYKPKQKLPKKILKPNRNDIIRKFNLVK